MARKEYKKEAWMSDFVAYELDKQQMEAVKKWRPWEDQYEDVILRAVEQDYKLTLSYDNKHKCYAAIMAPIGKDHVNAGWLLSGRGSTPMKAVRQVLYKHFVCADGDTWSLINSRMMEEIDD